MLPDFLSMAIAAYAALASLFDGARVWLYNPWGIVGVCVLVAITLCVALAAHYLDISELFTVYPDELAPEKAPANPVARSVPEPPPTLDDDIKRVVELVLRARDERREGDWKCMHLSLSEAIHHAQLIEQATGCTA